MPAKQLPPQTVEAAGGLKRSTVIALVSAVGAAAMLCVLAIMWISHSFHQEKVFKANLRISSASRAAGDWLQRDSPNNAEQIERELSGALGDKLATEKRDGESVLIQVRQRRQQFADQQKAVTAWKEAKRLIEKNQIAEGIAAIKSCLDSLPSGDKNAAASLLAEAEMAVSDDEAIAVLSALSDPEFDRVKSGGGLSDGKVKQPQLVAARNKTIQRNIPKAAQKRQEMRVAKLKQQEEARAAEERERGEIGGLWVGMTLEQLQSQFDQPQIVEIDLALKQKYGVYFPRDPSTRASIIHFATRPGKTEVIGSWTASDWAAYDAGRIKYESMLPAWMNTIVDNKTKRTIRDRYANENKFKWENERNDPPPPWRLFAIKGGPRKLKDVVFTEVRSDNIYGVFEVIFVFSESIDKSIVGQAMDEKFKRVKANLQIDRGSEAVLRGGKVMVEQRITGVRFGTDKWFPKPGISVSLSAYPGVVPELVLRNEKAVDENEKSYLMNRGSLKRGEDAEKAKKLGL